jgi:hypothetical protein
MLGIVISEKYSGTNLWKRGSCCLHQTEPTSLGEHSVPTPVPSATYPHGWMAEMTRSGDRESTNTRDSEREVGDDDLRLPLVCGESVHHCGFASCVSSSPGISVHPIDLGFPLWRETGLQTSAGQVP